MNLIARGTNKIKRLTKSITYRWKEPFKDITIPSSVDGYKQPAFYFQPETNSNKTPLVVTLHSWAATYKQPEPVISKHCVENNWHYIRPDFRGANNNHKSVGSDLSMSDINDAIQYAIDHGNVDLDNIFIVGGSGGAYASLCFYFSSLHHINSYIVWSPITDLVAWYDQSLIRKARYHQDILNGTNSTNTLNIEEAKKRSPLYRDIPNNESKLFIFSGYHDGYNGAPVPVTHSLNFYNKYVHRFNGGSSDYISKNDIILLTARELKMSNATIDGKKVVYNKSFHNAEITIFDGGHDHLSNHSVQLINDNLITNDKISQSI